MGQCEGAVVGSLEIVGEDRKIPGPQFSAEPLEIRGSFYQRTVGICCLFLSKSCISTCLRGILDLKKRDEGMAVAL